ncbi:hypothetical protein BDV93DRAFT_524340 [Ceratobasidium sp. AG-I]|nr:hypothetical protein BDV93DRAFT_524340 [Ceratobasidium sp. AG-I]
MSLTSDSNATITLTPEGDLKSLKSDHLGYKFVVSSTEGKSGTDYRGTFIYNNNQSPHSGEPHQSYRVLGAGSTTILFVCTTDNVEDPGASSATFPQSVSGSGASAFAGQGKWHKA